MVFVPENLATLLAVPPVVVTAVAASVTGAWFCAKDGPPATETKTAKSARVSFGRIVMVFSSGKICVPHHLRTAGVDIFWAEESYRPHLNGGSKVRIVSRREKIFNQRKTLPLIQ